MAVELVISWRKGWILQNLRGLLGRQQISSTILLPIGSIEIELKFNSSLDCRACQISPEIFHTILVPRSSGCPPFGEHEESRSLSWSNTGSMLRVKCDKSDWLRIRNDYSAHAQKIEPSPFSSPEPPFLLVTRQRHFKASSTGDDNAPSQKSQFLVLNNKSAASKDENVPWRTVKLILSGHPWDTRQCSLHTGCLL